jgi:plastocyanin
MEMRRRLRRAAALGAGALSLVALASAAAADRAVTISSAGFVPRDVTIAAHDSVTWRNADTKVHQVIFDREPCNLTIQPGASASCTFRAGGRFSYRDPTGPGGFRGTVTVTGPRASVTLAATHRVARFAAPVTVSGFVSSQQAGESVTLSAQQCGSTSFTRLAEATSAAGGTWSLTVKPTLNTVYRARWRSTESPTLTVNVRPAIRLTRVGSRFTVRLTAAQPLTGKVVFFQRFRPAVKRWATLKRVTLGSTRTPTAGTVVTSARFRSRVRRGWRVRGLLPQPQAGTCYVAGASNTLRIR